jgi:hypothetical protein
MVVSFRIQTVFDGSMKHLSPTATFNIICNNNYVLTPMSTVPTTKYVEQLGSKTEGFLVPSFDSGVKGCPIISM